MERFSEQAACDLAGNVARNRFAAELNESAPVAGAHECENCGRAVECLTLVPGFDYMGCDDCMVEALAALVAEQADAACAPKGIPASTTGRQRREVA